MGPPHGSPGAGGPHAADLDAIRGALVGSTYLELVEALGGSLARARRSGGQVRIPCLIHGGHGPNLILAPDRGLWRCVSTCDEGGDGIRLVERARGVDYRGAIAWLTEWLGMSRRVDRVPEVRRREPRPGRTPEPTPTADPGPLLTRLWAAVVDAPWSAPVARWLGEVRGIEPDAAYAVGCRDWSTVRGAIVKILDDTPPDVIAAAGLARDGRLHPVVSGIVRGDPDWRSVAVPAWPIGGASPSRWRWRLIAPGARAKSWSPYGGGAGLLGLGRPDRLDDPEVRLAWLGSGTEGAALVIVVEGEPDWLAVTEAIDGRAVVLGVCGATDPWRDPWPRLSELAGLGVRRIAVCVHHGPRGRDGSGHGERLALALARGCLRAGIDLRRYLPAEGHDLADRHRAGTLRAWLAPLLSEATWATT